MCIVSFFLGRKYWLVVEYVCACLFILLLFSKRNNARRSKKLIKMIIYGIIRGEEIVRDLSKYFVL